MMLTLGTYKAVEMSGLPKSQLAILKSSKDKKKCFLSSDISNVIMIAVCGVDSDVDGYLLWSYTGVAFLNVSWCSLCMVKD